MSQVMQALRQSELGYQSAQSGPNLRNRPAGQGRKRGHWSLWMAAVLLPALCSVSYQVYQTRQAWQEQLLQANLEQQEATLFAQQPVEPPVLQLEYPDFGELTPLSDIAGEVASTTVASKRVASTKVISAVPVRETLPEPEAVAEQPLPAPDREESEWDLSDLDLSGLSPELAQRFQSALDVDDAAHEATPAESAEPQQAMVRLVDSQSELRGRLPAMNLQTHMYASNEQSRWVKINGQELHEGEWLDNRVKLLTISPRTIVVEFDGLHIEIPALFEWEG